MSKVVFVTVGTTKFDALVQQMLTEPVQSVLKRQGFSRILIQAGESAVGLDDAADVLAVDTYAYKPSLSEDILSASLIISHAGAGTCGEVQSAGKPHVVVVNETLMGNHQLELAEKLAKAGHLLHCMPDTLANTLRTLPEANLTPWPAGNPRAFAEFLDGALFGNQ